jgi:hypothetical protein
MAEEGEQNYGAEENYQYDQQYTDDQQNLAPDGAPAEQVDIKEQAEAAKNKFV